MNDTITIRCPHCDQKFDCKIDNNELVKDGLMITPVAPDRCKHGLRSDVLCEMCDYDDADEAELVS